MEHYPEFDPLGTYESDTPLYAERFCLCGGIFRIRAGYEDLKTALRLWEAGHSEGDTHKRVGKLVACRAREARKKAILGTDYKPTNWDEARIGVSNAEVYEEVKK